MPPFGNRKLLETLKQWGQIIGSRWNEEEYHVTLSSEQLYIGRRALLDGHPSVRPIFRFPRRKVDLCAQSHSSKGPAIHSLSGLRESFVESSTLTINVRVAEYKQSRRCDPYLDMPRYCNTDRCDHGQWTPSGDGVAARVNTHSTLILVIPVIVDVLKDYIHKMDRVAE